MNSLRPFLDYYSLQRVCHCLLFFSPLGFGISVTVTLQVNIINTNSTYKSQRRGCSSNGRSRIFRKCLFLGFTQTTAAEQIKCQPARNRPNQIWMRSRHQPAGRMNPELAMALGCFPITVPPACVPMMVVAYCERTIRGIYSHSTAS